MVLFWLVLIAYGGPGAEVRHNPAMLHVGNFSSLSECQKAALNSTSKQHPALRANVTYYCVQANDANTQPPPN